MIRLSLKCIHRWLLVVYWPTLIVLTHIPIPRRVREADVSDKTLHVAAFMVLSFLLWQALNPGRRVRWNRWGAWICLGILLAFALVDEGTQSFLPDRSTDPIDLVADLVGSVLGLVVPSLLGYWTASLATYALFWFMITFCTSADLGRILRIHSTVLHVCLLVPFAVIWIASPSGPFPSLRSGTRQRLDHSPE